MVNGRPMHCNKRLLTTILREEWGVKSVLVESDGGDCIGALQYGFHAAASIEEAAIISLESGMFVRSSFCFLFSFFGVSWSFKTAGYVLHPSSINDLFGDVAVHFSINAGKTVPTFLFDIMRVCVCMYVCVCA